MSTRLLALQNKFLGHGETVYDILAKHHQEHGHITDEHLLQIAEQYNLPPQHVRSTAKFYEELSHDKPAKRTVKVCNGQACFAAGAKQLEKQLCDAGQVTLGQTNDQGVRIEHVACLGYCSQGPNVMVDNLPITASTQQTAQAVCQYIQTGQKLGQQEPDNKIYFPDAGQPAILLRHLTRPNQKMYGRTGVSPVIGRDGRPTTPSGHPQTEPNDVTSIENAKQAGIYKTLKKVLAQKTPQEVIDIVKASQLRGRGGAGFPTGIKWQTVADSPSKDDQGQKYVVVNFDEGDAGSYIDKELVQRDPHTQIEGILLASYACGANEAYIYVRYEYPKALKIIKQAVKQAQDAGIIGDNVFGSSFACNIKIIQGQGAYICGEETSLLRSIEGLPALVSFKPPFPAQEGLFGLPTAVNNVETLHNLPWILEHGGDAYAKFGHEKSRGTKAISLNSRVKRPGLYEVELGITLRQIIFDLAGGMQAGQTFKAVQVGGPLGGILPEDQLDVPLDFEAIGKVGGILGHAGIVVYSLEDNLVELCRELMAFCAVESCGKCFPCRIGSVRGTELFDQMMLGSVEKPPVGQASRLSSAGTADLPLQSGISRQNLVDQTSTSLPILSPEQTVNQTSSTLGAPGVTDQRLQLLQDLCETMKFGSLCALGGMIPLPIESLLKYFPEELEQYRQPLAVV